MCLFIKLLIGSFLISFIVHLYGFSIINSSHEKTSFNRNILKKKEQFHQTNFRQEGGISPSLHSPPEDNDMMMEPMGNHGGDGMLGIYDKNVRDYNTSFQREEIQASQEEHKHANEYRLHKRSLRQYERWYPFDDYWKRYYHFHPSYWCHACNVPDCMGRPIIGTITLGRQNCDVICGDKSVSRKHATIILHQDQDSLWFEDLNSRFNSFINDQKVTKRVRLKIDDQIKLGAMLEKDTFLIKYDPNLEKCNINRPEDHDHDHYEEENDNNSHNNHTVHPTILLHLIHGCTILKKSFRQSNFPHHVSWKSGILHEGNIQKSKIFENLHFKPFPPNQNQWNEIIEAASGSLDDIHGIHSSIQDIEKAILQSRIDHIQSISKEKYDQSSFSSIEDPPIKSIKVSRRINSNFQFQSHPIPTPSFNHQNDNDLINLKPFQKTNNINSNSSFAIIKTRDMIPHQLYHNQLYNKNNLNENNSLLTSIATKKRESWLSDIEKCEMSLASFKSSPLPLSNSSKKGKLLSNETNQKENLNSNSDFNVSSDNANNANNANNATFPSKSQFKSCFFQSINQQ